MSQASQLQHDAAPISFIRDCYFTAFLPTEAGGGGKQLENEWLVLAVLIEHYNSITDHRIVRRGEKGDFVRIMVYGSCTRNKDPVREHLIPIPPDIVSQLLKLGYVEGAMRAGRTDESELHITESGVNILLCTIAAMSR
jgi:hypothetical protein